MTVKRSSWSGRWGPNEEHEVCLQVANSHARLTIYVWPKTVQHALEYLHFNPLCNPVHRCCEAGTAL